MKAHRLSTWLGLLRRMDGGAFGLSAALALAAGLPAARAAVHDYVYWLAGTNESPANLSPGTGSGHAIYDDTAHTLQVIVNFAGLTGTVTAAHIHAPTVAPFGLNAGVATTTPTFPSFPLGVTSGSYNNLFDLALTASYNPTYVTANGGTAAAAEAALAAAMASGRAYFNIHTSAFPGGEIRGFLAKPPVVAEARPAAGGGISFGFALASGLPYRVQMSTAPGGPGSWSDLLPPQTNGASISVTITDAASAPFRLYRLVEP